VSLFTLHVIWPFLWIWATLYRPERGWGMQHRRIRTPSMEKEGDICAAPTLAPEQQVAASSPAQPLRWRNNHGSVDYFDLCGDCLVDI
jgi:hypothetical protein